MTYIVSGGALNSTHLLALFCVDVEFRGVLDWKYLV